MSDSTFLQRSDLKAEAERQGVGGSSSPIVKAGLILSNGESEAEGVSCVKEATATYKLTFAAGVIPSSFPVFLITPKAEKRTASIVSQTATELKVKLVEAGTTTEATSSFYFAVMKTV